MERVRVTDLYEAAYLILNDCRLTGVECVPVAGGLGCSLFFANGRDVAQLQEQYLCRRATVDLYSFRQAYNTVNGYIHLAKKSYDRGQRRREDQEPGSVDPNAGGSPTTGGGA